MTYELEIEIDDPHAEAIAEILAELEQCVHEIGDRWDRTEDRIVHTANLDEVLADQHAIAIVWDTRHVKDQRPDLTEEQAWEVLQACEHDRLSDPMLETIRLFAEKLYPEKRKASPSRVARIIADYEPNGDERENLVDLLADAMHWCESFGEPFEEFCGTARMHFEAEAQTSRKEA
jgi:hypothetical protein